MTRVRGHSRSIEKTVAEENRVGPSKIVIDAPRELVGIVRTDGVQLPPGDSPGCGLNRGCA